MTNISGYGNYNYDKFLQLRASSTSGASGTSSASGSNDNILDQLKNKLKDLEE